MTRIPLTPPLGGGLNYVFVGVLLMEHCDHQRVKCDPLPPRPLEGGPYGNSMVDLLITMVDLPNSMVVSA